jgi:Ca2+-binding EF-hand superfamily protein
MTSPANFDGTAKNETWLRAVFDRHDINRDGRLTLGEFIRVARWLNSAVTTEACETAFDLMDPDQSGTIDFGPFFTWWSKQTTR